MGIIKLNPVLKEIIWGGQRLKELYNGEGMENIAEAWVLSCHRDGESVVAEGEYSGLPLSRALEKMGPGAVGTARGKDGFPILIKFIDASDRLSVQVHPGNEYARVNENDSGKTEAWYILDCEPDSELIYGFKETLTREALRQKITDGSLLGCVNSVKVKKGDVAFIPSGTLHAIGAGILLAEVQQSSNATYRVFDYDRRGADGKTRELHVDKAVDVLDTSASAADFSPCSPTEDFGAYSQTVLSRCEYFTVLLLEIRGACSKTADRRSFVSLVILEGSGSLDCGGEKLTLAKGDSIFIPADSGDFALTGEMKILETRII